MHIFGGLYMKRLLSFALAFLLMLGLGSPALAAKAKAVTMRVELVEGSVTIRDAGGVALDYFEGIQLYSGYSVETGDDSCAYISLDEDKAIKLAMNTTVTIKKSGRKLQVKLKAGEIVFNVTTPLAGNETLEIRTSTMITGVRGSSGGVNAETGEIFYGTGHGIVWFRETDQTSSWYGLPQRTELWGGRIVSVNWPVKDMELSDFSALFLGEVAENPDLQNSLKMEGRFDPQDMINLLPIILEAEIAAREEAKSSAVPLPESVTDSPVNGDSVNPAFNKNWDLPTIVTPHPIFDLDDFVIPDDPLNPDEPETTAYTVTWKDEDGTILEKDENVPVGTVPEFNGSDPTKAADAQYTYSFAGWDSVPAAVTGDAIYTATYKGTPKTYTVTWKVDDETTTVKYDYGSVIVPPADPTKAGYTFTGWGSAVPETMPAEDLSFTAQWDVNTYTVTWKQNDGTVIDTTTVAYGEVPTHAAPTKAADEQFAYTFAEWDPTPVAVTGNATYTATYSTTTNTYTITWKQDDGSVIDSTTVAYGVVPTHADASKAETDDYCYSFNGWNTEPVAVTGDAVYTATYESHRIYHVVFYPGAVPDAFSIGPTIVDFDIQQTQIELTLYEDDVNGTNSSVWEQASSLARDKNGFAVPVGWLHAEDFDSYSSAAYPANDQDFYDINADIYADKQIYPDAPALSNLDLTEVFGNNATKENPYELYCVWSVRYKFTLHVSAEAGEIISFSYNGSKYSFDNSVGEPNTSNKWEFYYLYSSNTALPSVTVEKGSRSFSFWSDSDSMFIYDEISNNQYGEVEYYAIFNGYRLTLHNAEPIDDVILETFYIYDPSEDSYALPEFDSYDVDDSTYDFYGWFETAALGYDTGFYVFTLTDGVPEDKVFYGKWILEE